MTRVHPVTTLLAMGLALVSLPAAAQQPSPPSTGGQMVFGLLGVDNVGSAKFQEYRQVPKGASVPYANLFTKKDSFEFHLDAFKVWQDDQRYSGWLKGGWVGLSFDYNQTPHNQGFSGRSIFSESAPGVWTMSTTLREALQNAVVATPSTARTYGFYSSLLAPTFASTNLVDISGLRKRAQVEAEFAGQQPFGLTLTYMRELKAGYNGVGGGNIRGTVNPSYEVAAPLDQLNQDFGVGADYEFRGGRVYASFNRNLYDNRAEALTIDNPFQAFDALVVGGVGGPARDRIIGAPDNEASTGRAGFYLRFARQTRIGGFVSLARWTQDAPFYPYTANTAVLTPSGTSAASLAALPRTSYHGRIDTTLWNLTFSSRPVRNLGLRAQFRSHDRNDKSGRWVSTGDMSVPHQNWNTVTPSAEAPYGRRTANPYDTKTKRFTAAASYDLGGLTVEGEILAADIERAFREATSGSDQGYAISATYRASDWLRLRAKYHDVSRTAEGETFFGFSADEAERDTTSTSFQVDLSPSSNLDLTFSLGKRNIDFPNRPNRMAATPGAPEIPGTPSGLLEAKFDTYSIDIGFTPNERASLGGYYTYDKDRTVNQWATLTGVSLNNLLRYAGSNRGHTFGAHLLLHVVPDTWTLTLDAVRQKVDGLMDITAREQGSFYTPGRTTLIPPGAGGAADITDWDDTELTTFVAQLDHTLAKTWTLSVGYLYESYAFRDAFSATDLLMPQAVYIFLKANNGPYTANIGYGRLTYRF